MKIEEIFGDFPYEPNAGNFFPDYFSGLQINNEK
jgi:hypothetical protein